MNALLFVPRPLVLDYYSRLACCGSGVSKTGVWPITQHMYVFLAGTIFVSSVLDCARPSYDTHRFRFDNIISSLVFRLLDKFLEELKYFGLYTFKLRIGTDLSVVFWV